MLDFSKVRLRPGGGNFSACLFFGCCGPNFSFHFYLLFTCLPSIPSEGILRRNGYTRHNCLNDLDNIGTNLLLLVYMQKASFVRARRGRVLKILKNGTI